MPDPGERAIFLAGGLMDVPDWQSGAAARLEAECDLTPIHPRRPSFTEADHIPQIEWEFRHLMAADVLLFYFTKETLCPITLFEYGKWLSRGKRLFVAIEDGYRRSTDVVVQTRLERPSQRIWGDLDGAIDEAVTWSRTRLFG